MIDVGWGFAQGSKTEFNPQSTMDKWLLDLVDRLNQARARGEVMQVIDRLEDGYDTFAGPGEELVAQPLEQTRAKLTTLS